MASLSQKTIQKLTKISPSYNSFVPDQVLTHTQLNGIIDFFEDQHRMTRLLLSGSGIACGFQLSVIGDKLNLSQGTGITTDGDLIYNTITDGVIYKANCNVTEFTDFMDYDDSRTDYFKDLVPGYEDGRIRELIPTLAPPVSDAITTQPIDLSQFPNGEESIDDYVFFLYLESYEKESGACTSTSCENQGNERVHRLRYLMVPAEYAQALIDDDDANYKEKKSYETIQDGLKKLQVKRLIFHSGVDVLSANSSSEVANYYYDAIQDGNTLTDLKVGFNSMCDKFGVSYFDTEINTLLNFSSASIPSDVQYRFDLFKDLVETYNEARELLLKVDTYCCPALHSFPKHLMVNGFDTSNDTLTMTDHYRHDFYESPIIGDNRTNYLNLLSLLERARALVLHYSNLGAEGQTIVTPSNLHGTLGSKAIPFYYSRTKDFLDAWDFEKTSARLQDTHLSYNKGFLSLQPAIQNPLAYTLDENDFYRIEGHHGKAPQEVKEYLEEQIRIYGLDFEVMIADVSATEPNLSALVEKRPSITHYAGVPKGGTFILASENNAVFADFAIADKIPAENNGVGCCPLVECSYPYISSLKYLNNLSRSLNGTQNNRITMPSEYRLLITRYEINGQSIKNALGPDLIVIPLTDIFLRRTHAIMEALNTRYPRGVVFDYNESQKRMTVTRSKYDKYVIEMQDVTLSSLGLAPFQPVYTYSTTGMFCASSSPRKGLPGTHRPLVMVCRELREYNEAFYESLQGRLAPVGKDDDFTQYRNDWETFNKLKWRLPENSEINRLNIRRFINSQTQLPFDQQTTLFQMMNNMNGVVKNPVFGEVAEQAITLSYILDGDWVTGEYVEKNMYNIWLGVNETQVVKNEAEQEIFNFVEMKKHLNEDRGITKMSVYVSGVQYSPAFDQVIEDYADEIDFYFSCTPRGEYSIPLSLIPPTDPTGGGGTDPGGGGTNPVDQDPVLGTDTGGDTPATGGSTPGSGGVFVDIEQNDPNITQFKAEDFLNPEMDPLINPGPDQFTIDEMPATGSVPVVTFPKGDLEIDDNITGNPTGATFDLGDNIQAQGGGFATPEMDMGSLQGTPELGNVNIEGAKLSEQPSGDISAFNIDAASAGVNPTASQANFNISGARAAKPEVENTSDPKIENPIIGKTAPTSANRSIETSATPLPKETKAATKVTEPAKTVASKPVARKSTAKKPVAQKTPAKAEASATKAPVVKKPTAKKAATTATAAKKAPAKTEATAAKAPVAKKPTTKKAASTKTTAKKPVAKKAPVKKTVSAKKAPTAARKTTAKKSTPTKTRVTRKRNTKK